jgi:ribosomal protein L11 methyltransferase
LQKNNTMSYIVLKVEAQTWFAEMVQADLSCMGFDTFLETEKGFETSIEKELFAQNEIEQLFANYKANFDETFFYHWEEVAKQNWNELWESNFEPVIIGNKCLIRADFHQFSGQYEHELVITPKMSFGTGHHATTALMIEHLLETDLKECYVADCGCGTGILAIMAMKLGATFAIGCDIEDWAVENTIENAAQNGVKVPAIQGTALDLLPLQKPANQHTPIIFDVVIANIQLNVLLEEMPIYSQLLPKGGVLLLSGIHVAYIKNLCEEAGKFGFELVSKKEQVDWAAIKMKKSFA